MLLTRFGGQVQDKLNVRFRQGKSKVKEKIVLVATDTNLDIVY